VPFRFSIRTNAYCSLLWARASSGAARNLTGRPPRGSPIPTAGPARAVEGNIDGLASGTDRGQRPPLLSRCLGHRPLFHPASQFSRNSSGMRTKPRSSVTKVDWAASACGDQEIIAAHRLTAPFEIGTQPAIDCVCRRLERQRVKAPRTVSTGRASRLLPRLATPSRNSAARMMLVDMSCPPCAAPARVVGPPRRYADDAPDRTGCWWRAVSRASQVERLRR